jgi:hypothetical protein
MRTLPLLLIALSLNACVMGDKISEIRPGMTKAEVMQRLGTPDGYKSGPNGYEMLRYSNRLASGWNLREKGDYNVVLRNGIVTEYGQETVRAANDRTVIVPMRY